MEYIRTFVERKRASLPCSIHNKTKMELYKEMPNLCVSMTSLDFLYETEARVLLGEMFEFSKTATLCFVLAELYKFGCAT